MGEAFVAAPGQSVELSLALDDYTNSGIYPRARVYNPSGSLVGTVDLTHLANGRWTGPYTMPTSPVGVYTVHYAVYTDAGHTTLSSDNGADQDRITTDLSAVWEQLRAASGGDGTYGQAIKAILGISGKANMRIDNTTYDANGFLEQARIRVFETAAAAQAATVDAVVPEGEIATVTLQGVADLVHLALPNDVLGVFS